VFFTAAATMVAGLSYHFFEMPANRLVRQSFGPWMKKVGKGR
jgi:peptidoglycan/LPS O-acetylase OafA/YrhL